MNQEKEISKEEFKQFYFKYGKLNDGRSQEYWDHFFENEKNKKYYFIEPESSKYNRMFIVTDDRIRRMFLLTEEGEESFFDYPGKN
jgi:hypothetical protein